jgi:endonuclease III
MKIDYLNITNYQRNINELLGFLLWCTVTPGKRSDVITPKFNNVIKDVEPSDLIKCHGKTIKTLLEKEGIGQYTRILKCWKQIAKEIKPLGRLKYIKRDELIAVDGIGNKTASFFIAHSQPWSEIAVLDVHILRYLKKMFPNYLVPEQTPQDLEEYKRLEYMFLGIAASQNKTPAELDNEIWQSSTISNNTIQNG